MAKQTTDDHYSEPEASRRRDELLRRLLHTPPQPRSQPKAKPAKGAAKAGRQRKVAKRA